MISMIKLFRARKARSVVHLSAILLSLATIFLASCAKDPGKIGLNLQPEDSKLKVFYADSTGLMAYSQLEDSVRSDELTRNAIGYLNDPVFGATKASFCTQFQLSTNGHDFGEDRELDSLVLFLYYSGAYADTNSTLTINTFEIDDKEIHRDSVYYSNKELKTFDISYSTFSFQPRPNDSVIDNNDDTLAPHIRINLTNLNTELGLKLLNATEEEMEDTETFTAFFNGLYLTPESITSTGTLAYFDLTRAASKMTIYYKNATQDSLQYDYLISTSTARINFYEHDYTNASTEFKQQVIQGDTALGKLMYYTQGYAGVRSLIRMPQPENWRSLVNVAVNEAKLTLPLADITQFYDAPVRLALVEKMEDGSYDFLPDQYEGEDYFGGDYKSGRYMFRITRYIQNLIKDSTYVNRGLYLFVNSESVNPESVILSGFQPSSDTTARMKLEIIYTDLD